MDVEKHDRGQTAQVMRRFAVTKCDAQVKISGKSNIITVSLFESRVAVWLSGGGGVQSAA